MENDEFEDFVISMLNDAQDWQYMTVPTREGMAKMLAERLRRLIDGRIAAAMQSEGIPVYASRDATDDVLGKK